MFSAIGRYIRAFFYLITGRIDKARKSLMSNPTVVEATYDNIIEEKAARCRQYKDALGKMVAKEEEKKDKLRVLATGDHKDAPGIPYYTKLKAGAAAKARELVAKHGGDAEKVKSDPEYIKCQAAFRDFTSTLEEKEKAAKELEVDLAELGKNIGGHKANIQGLLRDLDKLKSEKHEAVADIISAKEEKEIADMINGIAEDRSAKELQELRELRREAKGQAKVSRELSGLDNKVAEADFLAYAESTASDNEFDKLIGLTKETPAATTPASTERTSLPEA